MTLAAPLRPLSHPDLTHVVVQVLQEMNYDVSDKDRFLKQAQNVDFGLGAEHEFAAIAAWLGRCKLIHQRGQEPLYSSGFPRDMVIPDLLAMIEYKGQMRLALIEVKTRKCAENPEEAALRIKPKYLHALYRYAEMLALPLLIAWHPRPFPFWTLFDPRSVTYDNDREGFSFFEVMKNDLMGSVFGDFSISPMVGAGISVHMEIVGPKQSTSDGYQANMRVTDAYWHDPEGHRIEDAAEGVLAAILATGTTRTTQHGNGIKLSFVAKRELTRAQIVLKMLAGWNLDEGQRVHWRSVAKALQHFLPRDKLLADLQRSFGSCIRYVLHVVPQVWPAFVPEEWKGR